MAYFKLSLLTPHYAEDQQISFIEDKITEFDIPESKSGNLFDIHKDKIKDINQDAILINKTNVDASFSYTYNEKVSFSQNAQKTLSFDLNRYIVKENEYIENPFASLISEGSQILLTDQYYNEYIFTVTSTKFNIKENNIVYNITCQDSFSYQATRQNDGYTIENNYESGDFIGAKTVDWWVLNKIIPECSFYNYKYLTSKEGLYESLSGEYKTFTFSETLTDVKRIIKDAHQPPKYEKNTNQLEEENDIEYFEQVPFSCSGVTANAALISLGEQVNMQLCTFEHAQIKNEERNNIFDKYFWYEPTKNEKRVGLSYSPLKNISKFDLTHNGQSLTTILNVEGPQYDDEMITLFPTVPQFFLNYFNSADWKTSSYAPGFFQTLCNNQILRNTTETEIKSSNIKRDSYFYLDISNATTKTTEEGKVLSIPIYTHKKQKANTWKQLFSLAPYYNRLFFRYSSGDNQSNKISHIFCDGNMYTPDNSIWALQLIKSYWAFTQDNIKSNVPIPEDDLTTFTPENSNLIMSAEILLMAFGQTLNTGLSYKEYPYTYCDELIFTGGFWYLKQEEITYKTTLTTNDLPLGTTASDIDLSLSQPILFLETKNAPSRYFCPRIGQDVIPNNEYLTYVEIDENSYASFSRQVFTNKTENNIPDLGTNTYRLGDNGYWYINNQITNITKKDLINATQVEIAEDVINATTIQERDYIEEQFLDVTAYLTITEPSISTNITFPDIYINCTRNVTDEELDFARIADACPWLENKLIDFSYFRQQNIISIKEYNSLMNIILNDLRKVNGSLMFYAQGYYRALQDRTKLLAELTNNLDSIGAACQAAVIDPMTFSGGTSDDNRQYFENAYNLIFNSSWQRKGLIKYDEVLNRYFQDYFNAQQRFLKNLYNFKEFFNASYVSHTPHIYNYTLQIQNTLSDIYYTFNNTLWNPIDTDFNDYVTAEDSFQYGKPFYTLYNLSNTNITTVKVASKDQLGSSLYYLPSISEDQKFYCNSSSTMTDEQYGQIIFKVPINNGYIGSIKINPKGTKYTYASKNDPAFPASEAEYDGLFSVKVGDDYLICYNKRVIKENNAYFALFYQVRQGAIYTTEDNKIKAEPSISNLLLINGLQINQSYSTSEIHAIKGDKNFDEDVYNEGEEPYYIKAGNSAQNINITPQLVSVTNNELIENYILNHTPFNAPFTDIVKHHTPLYTEMPITKYNTQTNKMESWNSFDELRNCCYNTALYTSDDFDNLSKIELSAGTLSDKEKYETRYYRQLPITDLYANLPRYIYEENIAEDGEVTYNFKRINNKGQTITNYLDWLYKTKIKGEILPNIINPYTETVKTRIPYVTYTNEQNFYRRVMTNPPAKWWYFMSIIFPPLMAGVSVDVLYHMDDYYKWSLSGFGHQDIYGNKLSNRFSGYYDYIGKTYENLKNINIAYPIYTVKENTISQLSKYWHSMARAASIKTDNFSSGSITIPYSEWNNEWLALPVSNITTDNSLNITLTVAADIYNKLKDPEWNQDIDANFLTDNTLDVLKGYKMQNIGYTFKDVPLINPKVTFIDTQYYALKKDDKIYREGRYGLLLVDREDDDAISNIDYVIQLCNKPLSGTLYYPLINRIIPLDLNQYEWRSTKEVEVSEFFAQSPYGWHLYDNGSNEYCFIDAKYKKYAIIFNIKDFDTTPLSVLYNNFDTSYYTQAIWYDNTTLGRYDFLSKKGITEGYFRIPNTSSDLRLTSIDDEFNMNGVYYDSLGNRIYTIEQLKNSNTKYYYIKSISKNFEFAEEWVDQFPFSLIRNHIIRNREGEIERVERTEVEEYYLLDFSTITHDLNNPLAKTITVNIRGEDLTFTVTRSAEPLYNLQGLTNGSFWYHYRNAIDYPLLFEQAAAIETQLTEYWTSAYYASKGCEYFLPEFWTPYANQKDNSMFNQLFIVTEDDIHISNTYIPNVKIDSSQKNSARYVFKFFNELDTTDDLNQDRIIDNDISISVRKLTNNKQYPAIYNAFVHLIPEDLNELDNWTAYEAGRTVYYYVDDGSGMLWEDFVGSALKRPGAYQEISGNYVMGYRILRQWYFSNPFSQYHSLQEQHNNIWKKLYTNYGYLMLENAYKNDSATNSTDLLKMAQFFFKDKMQPERGYNISIIDTSSLDNYKGAEIRIGDGIYINVAEYYDNYDLIYQSLSQYLFITDLSYTLRNATDITLTVNSIKYEEGIIKRLAKLIK